MSARLHLVRHGTLFGMKHWLMTGFVVLLVGAGALLSGCGLQQQKQRAGLQIETGNEQPVAVYLNGTFLNHVPMIDKNLRPGKHALRLVPTDPTLVPYETIVELHEGTITWVIWNPGPSEETSGGTLLEVEELDTDTPWWQFFRTNANAESRLSFESLPGNAIVSIDNEAQVRFTPSDYIDFGEKTVSFTITLPSYETQAHSIELQPGYRVKIISKLAKKDALLAASVVTDTAVLGTTDDIPSGEPLSSEAAVPGVAIRILPTQFRLNGEEVLRVRESPDAKSVVIDHAVVGKTYPFLGERLDEWVKIQTATSSGWVSSAFTQEVASPSATE